VAFTRAACRRWGGYDDLRTQETRTPLAKIAYTQCAVDFRISDVAPGGISGARTSSTAHPMEIHRRNRGTYRAMDTGLT